MIGAAILRVVAALDPAGAQQPPGLAADADLFHLQALREFALGAARLPGDVIKKEPLGARQPQRAHAAVELLAREMTDIADDEAKALFKLEAGGDHRVLEGQLVS